MTYPTDSVFSQPTSPTLGSALVALLAHTQQRVKDRIRAVGTLTMQESHVGWLLQQLPPDLALGELTSARVYRLAEHWHAHGGQEGRPISLKTLAKRLSTLRRALRLAAQRGELAALPLFPEIGLPPHRARLRILKNHSELDRLLAALSPERADWVSIAIWTCQRPGDIERMRWCDVSLQSTPDFVPSMLIRSTKTRRPDGIRVKMPAPMAVVLAARRDRLTAAGRPPADEDPIVRKWPNRSAVLPLVSVRLGLPPISAMDLRHTGISWMVRRIGLTRAAQEWGGWSDFSMMSRYYAHALPPQLTQASDELASIVLE